VGQSRPVDHARLDTNAHGPRTATFQRLRKGME
jgi:hypothetical protein